MGSFFFQAEDGIRDFCLSRGLGDVYKRQHPASVDSIPTSANQEDHVSMGSIAARHARLILEGVQRIVSIELIVAAQALDLRLASMAEGGEAPGPGAGVAEAQRRIRSHVAH